jgi:carboxypeptidase Taq
MGYFPTYTLGNVMALQFYRQALQLMPNLPEQYTRGEFGELFNWLKDNIYQHGRKFTANELIRQITGAEGLNAQPYLDYITQKYREIYGL